MGIFNVFKKARIDDIEDDLEIKEIDNNEKHGREKNFSYNFKIEETNPKEAINKDKSKSVINLTEEEIDKVIIDEILKVINNHKDFTSIEYTAKDSVRAIGINNVERLKDYLIGKVSKPSWMKGRYEGLGDWPMVVENAVLTIIYCFEEDGVDELLKISMLNIGTRFKAMNLLCKLASKGIERDKIIDSIIYIMKPLKEEEVLKVLGFLSQVKNHPKVERLLNLYYKKYIFENKYQNAYDTVLSIINFKGKCTIEQLTFLKAIAIHDGELEVSLLLKDEEGVVNIRGVEQSLKINAALTFYSLNNTDKEIKNMLIYLMENSLDDELRGYLSSMFSN